MPSLISRTPVKATHSLHLSTDEETRHIQNQNQNQNQRSSLGGLSNTTSATLQPSNRNYNAPNTPVPISQAISLNHRLSLGNELTPHSSLPRSNRIPLNAHPSSQETYFPPPASFSSQNSSSQSSFSSRLRNSNQFLSRLSFAPLSLSSSQPSSERPGPFSPSLQPNSTASTKGFPSIPGSHPFATTTNNSINKDNDHFFTPSSSSAFSASASAASTTTTTTTSSSSSSFSSSTPKTSNMPPLTGPTYASAMLPYPSHSLYASSRSSLGGRQSLSSTSTTLYYSNGFLIKTGALEICSSYEEFKVKSIHQYREFISKTIEDAIHAIRKEYLRFKSEMNHDNDIVISLERERISLKSEKASAETLLQKQREERQKQSNEIFQLKKKVHELKEKINATHTTVQQYKQHIHQCEAQLKHQQATRRLMREAAQREINVYTILLGLHIVPGHRQVSFIFDFAHSDQAQLVLWFPTIGSSLGFPEMKQCVPWVPLEEVYLHFKANKDMFTFLKQVRAAFLHFFTVQHQQQPHRRLTQTFS